MYLLGNDAVPARSWDGVEGDRERARWDLVDSRWGFGFQDQLKFVWRGERKNKRSVERKKGKP